MKLSHLHNDAINVSLFQPIVHNHFAEQCLLRETSHFYCIFDRLLLPVQLWLLRGTRNTHHRQIELWREPAVQTQLFFTIEPTLVQRGEIQKPQIQGLFYFIGIRATQDHPRDMGLNQLPVVSRMGKER